VLAIQQLSAGGGCGFVLVLDPKLARMIWKLTSSLMHIASSMLLFMQFLCLRLICFPGLIKACGMILFKRRIKRRKSFIV
jgi:hypothetical protein